jgi:DNA polymerase-3 subunit chi
VTEKVDFYVLNSSAARQRWLLACRLAERAYLNEQRVLILSGNPVDARALDELLWTFDERAFVPHALGDSDPSAPVCIAARGEPLPAAQLLVNLSDTLPASLEPYTRLAEILDADEERRRLGRERFKAYRDLKIPLDTHQLADAAAL